MSDLDINQKRLFSHAQAHLFYSDSNIRKERGIGHYLPMQCIKIFYAVKMKFNSVAQRRF